MNPLYVVHTPEILALLVFLFACAALPMFIFQRTTPSLVPEVHPKSRWLDGLRGVAAIMVSLNHAPFVLINLAVVPKVFYFDPADSELLKFLGAIGVQIFFCITGLLFASKVLSDKPVDWSDFFVKRVRRIVPAYFAAAVLAITVGFWFSWPIHQDIASMVAAIPALFGFGLLPLPTLNEFNFARLMGVSWSLAIEWRFYLVLPLIYIAIKKSRNITLLSIIVFALLDLFLNGASAWVFFIPGALCSMFSAREFSKNLRGAALILAIAAISLMFYRFGHKGIFGLEQFLNVSVIFAALTIACPSLLTTRTLVAMGSVSYSFYLLHAMLLFLVFGAVHFYWVEISELSLAQFAVLAGCTLAFASIVSTLSFVFIERRFMHTAPVKSRMMAKPQTA